MKKTLLLFTLMLFISSLSVNAQTYPIFGQFALGMDEETFKERLDSMKAHNVVQKEEYGLTVTDYQFKLGGWAFSIYWLNLNDLSKFWYDQIKEEKYNPIEYSNCNFTIDEKVRSLTFFTADEEKVANMGVFVDKDSPSFHEYNVKGLYILSATKHSALLDKIAPLKDILSSKFGQPVVTHSAANKVTFAKGQKRKQIDSPHLCVTKRVPGGFYDSLIPLYEWQQGNMRIVLGTTSINAVPYITFYDSSVLNQQSLDALFANADQQPKELDW